MISIGNCNCIYSSSFGSSLGKSRPRSGSGIASLLRLANLLRLPVGGTRGCALVIYLVREMSACGWAAWKGRMKKLAPLPRFLQYEAINRSIGYPQWMNVVAGPERHLNESWAQRKCARLAASADLPY